MEVTFDPAKDATNKRKHGISLREAESFDIDSAWFVEDTSQPYGEVRYNAIGWIGATLHYLTFTVCGAKVRPISLRKATKQEERLYAAEY